MADKQAPKEGRSRRETGGGVWAPAVEVFQKNNELTIRPIFRD